MNVDGVAGHSKLTLTLISILVFQILTVMPLGNNGYNILAYKDALGQTSTSNPTSYSVYQNEKEGVSIEYPSDWTYSEKTVGSSMITSFSPHQGSATIVQLFYDPTTSYVGTDQQILDKFPQIISRVCASATIAQIGFSCSNFQYDTRIGHYRGLPVYVMISSMIETFSDGSSREQDIVHYVIITQNSDYGIVASCPPNQCNAYSEQIGHFADSLNIYSVAAPSDNSANNSAQQNTSVQSTSTAIPSWIKNTAKWWSAGSLSDDDFVKGIQYLVQNGIIVVPITQVSSQSTQGIPSWVKNTAKWWSAGSLSDDDFVKGIQYLVQNGIIVTQVQEQQAPSDLLAGATFYTGTYPEPKTVTYTDKDGITLSVDAIPGQVLLYVLPSSSHDDVVQAVTSNGGTILSGVPAAGYYLVQVDDVQNFISNILQKSFVTDAHPNLVLSNNQASLGSSAPVAIINYHSGPAKNPDPNSRVIIAVIDDFAGCGVLKVENTPHGCKVLSEIYSKTPGIPILALQADLNSQETFNQDQINNNILRAIDTAKANNQKLVISESIGPELNDKTGKLLDGAMEDYYNFVASNLILLSNSDYVKDNVLFYQSAGNDRQDVSPAIEKLANSDIYKNNYNLVGQLDKNTQQPMDYPSTQTPGSNKGKGIIYDDSTASCCQYGTSFTGPNLAAGAAAIWADNPNLKAGNIHNAISDSSGQNTNKNGYPLFSPQNAYNVANKCLPLCNNISYQSTPNGGPSNANPSNQGNQGNNPSNANQGNNPSNANQGNQGNQGRYGGYNTPDAYCKGNYGSDYYYDPSRNVCAPRLQYSNQGSNALGIDLSGGWSGTARGTIVYTDPDPSYNINCNFQASVSLNLQQIKNSLTGTITVNGLSLSGQNCDQIEYSEFGGDLQSTIFGSGFSGTAGPLSVSGQFTEDLMRGHYSGDVEDHTINGDFTASRSG